MPYSVRCKACSAAFAIPDEIWDRRVRGRQATLKCRSCKSDIEVDGTKENAGKPSELPAPMAGEESSRDATPSSNASSSSGASAPAGESAKAGTSSSVQNPPSALATAPGTPPNATASASATVDAVQPMSAVTDPVTSTVQAAPVSPGKAVAAAARSNPSPLTTHATSAAAKPVAKAPSDVAATESGWSIMPPPSELAGVGVNVKPPEQKPPEITAPPSVQQSSPSAAASTKPRVQAQAVAHVPGTTSLAGRKGAATARATSEPREAASTAVTRSRPDAAPIPDPWVVSYGDEDDRELTEEQIALELSRGHINGMTIVWREDLPEWLPISGVKELAKHIPTPKTVTKTRTAAIPRASLVSSPTLSTPLASKAATAATSSPKTAQRATVEAAQKSAATSNVPRQPIREKQPSASALGNKATVQRNKQPSVPAPAQTPSPAYKTGDPKGPPPLSRTGKPAEPPARSAAGDGKPPALPSQPSPSEPDAPDEAELELESEPEPLLEASVPWRKAQESSDEVLTSAPNIDQVSSPQHHIPVEAPAFIAESAPNSPVPVSPAPPQLVKAFGPEPSFPASGEAKAGQASATPWGKASFRPPKPVETATSMVVHTTTGSADVLSITDEDFLAMQRRFPKWALPVTAGGAILLVGVIFYALADREEPPPLPVVPVVPTAAAEAPRPRHAQPDLSSPPVSSSKGETGGEQDFGKAFAQAANKGQGSFDPKVAERSASAALERASKCRVGAEPAGQVRTIVTIAPTGQVTSVQVAAPHAATATGKCIDTALRGFTVRPFQGPPAKLPLIVSLR